MNSRIFSGNVMHARQTPLDHRWVFPYVFYLFDLDELDELDRTVTGFGHNRWKPVALHDDDYLRGSGSIRDRLATLVDLDGVEQIYLVTAARFMVRVFNPVSFYYCLRADGTPVHVVAEVNNTFGDRHLYVLDGGEAFPLERQHDKGFHVSPFNNMEGRYRFTFSAPGDAMRITIRLTRGESVIMDAAIWGPGRPLTTGTLWKTLLVHPFTAFMTMPRIIWQAAILHYRKKLPVFKRPEPTNPMTIKVKA